MCAQYPLTYGTSNPLGAGVSEMGTRAWSSSSSRDRLRCSEFFNARPPDRKSTRLNSSHLVISYAVFCLKKKPLGRSGAELLAYRLSRSPHARPTYLRGAMDTTVRVDSAPNLPRLSDCNRPTTP